MKLFNTTCSEKGDFNYILKIIIDYGLIHGNVFIFKLL